MTGKLLVAFVTVFAFTAFAAAVTLEDPVAHQTYVDSWGQGAFEGTVTGEFNESDGDWSTYTEVRSNGNHSMAIIWHSEDDWLIPVGFDTAWLNLKIEAPVEYVFQGEQHVFFWNRVGDRGLQSSWRGLEGQVVDLGGAYYNDPPHPDPLSGMLETSVPVPPQYISATGDITTRVRFVQKHNTESWSRLYETSLTAVPEPATLSLMVLGGLAVLRRRRKCRPVSLSSA